MASRSPIGKVVNPEDRDQADRELQQLVDAVPQHIVVLSGDGLRLYANQAARDYHSLTLDQFLVEPIINCFHADDIENYSRIRDSGIASGEPWEAEARLRRQDGAYRWFLIRGKPLRNEQGLVLRWYLTRTDIEDRKQVERELQQLVDAVPHQIVVLAPDGRRLYANQVALDFRGLTLQEFLDNRHANPRLHPDDFTGFWDARKTGIASGAPFQTEARLLTVSGQYRWFLFLYNPHRDAQGHIVRWYGTTTDIEDRKQAERELRRLVDAVPHFMIVLYGDGRHLYVNEVALDFFGWSLDDFFDDNKVTQAFHPEDLAGFLESRQRGISDGIPFKIEARIRRKDGLYRWFLFLYNPCLNEQGQIDRWYATGTDIEDRKRAEDALRASEQFSRLVVDSIPDFACTMTAEGEVEFVNQRILDYTGWTLEELKSWAPLVHQDDLALVLTSWKHSVVTGDPFDLEERIRGADGRYRWFHARGIPGRDAQGRITRWYLLLSDIEDLKRAEEALQRAQVELAHVTRVTTLGELAASIAHEINQPLSAIVTGGSASLRWLAGDSPNLEEAREMLRRVIRDGNRASEVVARIRALSRKTGTQKERLDVNEAIREVIALAQGQLRRNKVALKTELAGDLPPVLGDRVQVQQVVLNLIINGVEAMIAIADRSRELVIKTQGHGGDNVHVVVQDSGVGLDPQSVEQIFDAFYTTKPGGMGMGLSISRSIVENHGGRLWARRNDGPGATFEFTLSKYH